MAERQVVARQVHADFVKDLTVLLQKHSATLSKVEVLALASNVVGKLIALQDQRTTTPEIAMNIVIANIEIGNKEAAADLMAGAAGQVPN